VVDELGFWHALMALGMLMGQRAAEGSFVCVYMCSPMSLKIVRFVFVRRI